MDATTPTAVDVQAERAMQSARGLDKAQDKRLREAAGDFEAIFISMMMQSMRKAFPKNEMFHGGQGEDVFQGLMDQELSKRAAMNGRGIGIGEMLYKSLARSANVDMKA